MKKIICAFMAAALVAVSVVAAADPKPTVKAETDQDAFITLLYLIMQAQRQQWELQKQRTNRILEQLNKRMKEIQRELEEQEPGLEQLNGRMKKIQRELIESESGR